MHVRPEGLFVGLACTILCVAGCDTERGEVDEAAIAARRAPTNRTMVPPPPLPSAVDSTHTGPDGGEALDAATLDRFAAAVIGVQRVETELAFDLSHVGRPDEAGVLRDVARRERIRAVERTGMSAEEYAQIARRVEDEPALRARLERRLRASRASRRHDGDSPPRR